MRNTDGRKGHRPPDGAGRGGTSGARDDTRLRTAVEAIVASCGEADRQFLDHLDRRVILQLSRTSPERQRFELDQVRQGRRPFTVKSTVFDTTDYREVGSRVARAGVFVNKAAQFVLRAVSRAGLTDEDQVTLGVALRSALGGCRTLYRLVRSGYAGRPPETDDSAPGFEWQSARVWEDTDLDR